MGHSNLNYASDIESLRELEFGDRFEPFTRLVGVAVAGIFIFLYTDWNFALVWPIYFIVAFGVHITFLSTRKTHVSKAEIGIAALLFTNLQISYSWLPTLLFSSSDRALMLVGAVLIGAQLLFLVRRSDTIWLYTVAQAVVVLGMSIATYIAFIPYFNTVLAFVGAGLSMAALNYYFLQSIRVARRLRISRETAARQAHQAQKMAAIGQLAGGVAHDFNNNLTAIIGSLELIQLTNDPQEHKTDVDNALVAARQAATTVKQLMIFARMKKADITVIRLQEAFAELGVLTKRLIPVSVTFDASTADPDLTIRADRNQLLTGLINLVVNSVDAMPQGGFLELFSKRSLVSKPLPLADGSHLTPGEYVLITVADTGEGIPAHIMPKVIDPFFTTKPVGKGTGLGLSMVAGMLQEFDGGLSIQSDQSGTRVSLYLPLVSPAEYDADNAEN